jgi:hypothetical protein
MAYVSQEMKAKIAPKIKALLKTYGLKGTLSVRHHSTLVLTVSQGKIDFVENYIKADEVRNFGRSMGEDQKAYVRKNRNIDVNTHWCQEHFTGRARDFLVKAVRELKGADYFDESDAQTDYFHCSHYIGINIGRWDRPYALVK